MIIDQLLTIDSYVYLCYFKVSLHTYILSLCVLDSVAIVDQLGQYDCSRFYQKCRNMILVGVHGSHHQQKFKTAVVLKCCFKKPVFSLSF